MISQYDRFHGDEDELEYDRRQAELAYEEEHADDFKYTMEWAIGE